MKIKLPHELEVKIPLDDLISLAYNAKRSEVLLVEKKSAENKIVRMKAELGQYQAKLEKINAARKGAAGQDGEAETVQDGRAE